MASAERFLYCCYPDLKIELWNGNDQKRTYRQSPYDLCFLFEKQNQDDKHLDGFEESKRNVANCVWMQTMNPVLEQNGSLEDNLFKIVSTSSQDKRYNRFAGMGIAQLIYPYPTMAPYFAMVMAEEVVGLDWSAADAAWLESLREQEDLDGPQMSEEEFYVNYAENRDEWGPLIVPVVRDRWVESYLEAVEAQIKTRFEQNKGEVLTQCRKKLESLQREDNREGWSQDQVNCLREQYDQIKQEQAAVLARNKDFLKRKLLGSLDGNKKKQKLEEYQIEYWLLPKSGPGTPPENRYFLARAMWALEKRCRELEQKEAEKQNQGREFEGILKRLREEQATRINWRRHYKEKTGQLNSALEAVEESFCITLKLEIYQELLYMVKGLWQAYKALLQDYREWAKSEKTAMRKNLVDRFRSKDGQPVRYVCASEDCLVQMEKLVRDGVRNKDYGAGFAKELCAEALQQRNKGLDAKAGKLKDFWEQQFQTSIGGKLDVDVLTALENEACWSYEKEHKKPLSKSNPHYNSIIKSYMEDQAFQKVRDIFVRAFLRIPNIRQRHTLEMCIYPAEIPEDNVLLQEIVKEQLASSHGVENSQGDSRDKYHIDFYRAVFGVSAGEVSALLYEEEHAPIPSGDGHNDYAAMIRALDWQKRRSNFLTPHIDWRWHKTTAMPELSAKYGSRRSSDLLLAVFFGLWSGKIRREDGTYKIGILNGQDYGRSEQRIEDFYQLVDTVDESPAISAALLDELAGCRQSLDEAHTVEREFAAVVDQAITEYCGRKLVQEYGKDELAYVMARALLRLVYSLWIQDNYRKVSAAAEVAQTQLDLLLSGTEADAEIKSRMREFLAEEPLKLWLEAEITKKA